MFALNCLISTVRSLSSRLGHSIVPTGLIDPEGLLLISFTLAGAVVLATPSIFNSKHHRQAEYVQGFLSGRIGPRQRVTKLVSWCHEGPHSESNCTSRRCFSSDKLWIKVLSVLLSNGCWIAVSRAAPQISQMVPAKHMNEAVATRRVLTWDSDNHHHTTCPSPPASSAPAPSSSSSASCMHPP